MFDIMTNNFPRLDSKGRRWFGIAICAIFTMFLNFFLLNREISIVLTDYKEDILENELNGEENEEIWVQDTAKWNQLQEGRFLSQDSRD